MRWVIFGALSLLAGPLLMLAPVFGLLVDPWAPFRLSGRAGETPATAAFPITLDPGDLSPIHGRVSDVQRYQLARTVGWDFQGGVIATAISIAENGSGDPAALSGLNRNGSRDLGLWQINSGWWPQFGGQQALTDSLNNARAAISIYGRQGWCAWSTYESSCGAGHTGTYRQFMARAAAAAAVQPPPGQA
jgi:hypothetical protein